MSGGFFSFWWGKSADFRFNLLMCWFATGCFVVGVLILSRQNLDFVGLIIGYANMAAAGLVFGICPFKLRSEFKRERRGGVGK